MKNTNKNKTTKKLPVPGKVKKGFRLYLSLIHISEPTRLRP